MQNVLDRLFKLKENNTTVRTGLRGGLVTFPVKSRQTMPDIRH